MRDQRRFILRSFSLLIVLGVLNFAFLNTSPIAAEPFWNKSVPGIWNKKGLGASIWQDTHRGSFHPDKAEQAAERLRMMRVSWYYTWDPDPLTVLKNNPRPGDPRFIPMIYRDLALPESQQPSHTLHGYKLTLHNQINRIRNNMAGGRKFPLVLLYNEPDNNTAGHPYHDPVAVALKTNNFANAMSDIAVRLGAPAMAVTRANYVFPSIEERRPRLLQGLTDGERSEREDLIRGKTLPWYRVFLSHSSAPVKSLMSSSAGRPLVPVHIYPDPFQLKVAQSRSDLELGSPKRENAKRAIINHVLRFLHDVRREFGAQIMITEFNIADWATKSWNSDRPAVAINRIPEDFVAEVLAELLPEISSLAYVSHYALFSVDRNYGENLRTSATFDSYRDALGQPRRGELTTVGRIYADFRDVACQRGEFFHQGKFIEFRSSICGEPVRFGSTANGWYRDVRSDQWRRELTPEQAGFFPEDGKINRSTGLVCRHRRFAHGNEIFEVKTAGCSHDPSDRSWTENRATGEKQKRYNIRTDRVGVMGYYFN